MIPPLHVSVLPACPRSPPNQLTLAQRTASDINTEKVYRKIHSKVFDAFRLGIGIDVKVAADEVGLLVGNSTSRSV